MLAKSISLRINPEKILSNVSPLLLGHFIENMFDCIDPGLHAQVLVSRGFEFPDENGDGVSDPWYPEGNGEFYLDTEKAISPSYSQRIRSLENKEGCGIAQDDLLFHKDESYEGSFWLYAEAPASVQLTVVTESNQVLFSKEYIAVANKWTKYSFCFFSACEQVGKLRISVFGGAEVWLDQVSLMPGNAVCKTWPEVIKYIKKLNPSVMRFPGGCFADCYHWQDGIGEPDFRPARPNAHWDGTEENGFGTDEFIALCRELDCEPMICINFGSGTPEEAAGWVEYCNGAPDSKYGALRAANGHAEPYGVRYWDIGNEAFADWEIGHCDADEYCKRFLDFANAMRKVDPEIKLIACGGDGNSSDQSWNRTLCQKIGHIVDFLGVHNYTPLTEKKYPDPEKQYYAVAGAPVQYENRMRETAKVLQTFAPNMKLAVTEWNCNYQDGSDQEQTMEAAICNAGMINAFFRMGEILPITMISDLINGWPGGIIRSRNGKCFGTPSYHVLSMYAQAKPAALLDCSYSSPGYSAEDVGNLKKTERVPFVDIVACKTEEDQICIFVVNRDLNEGCSVFFPEGMMATSITTITSNGYNDRNTQEEEVIIPQKSEGMFEKLDICPCSVSMIYLG